MLGNWRPSVKKSPNGHRLSPTPRRKFRDRSPSAIEEVDDSVEQNPPLSPKLLTVSKREKRKSLQDSSYC